MLPLAAIPSSSVALVVSRSVTAGRVNGAASALGIVAGDLVFVALALLGMTVLAEWLGALFTFVKYCAAAYLIWLGIGLLRSKANYAVDTGTAKAGSLVADFLAGLFLTLGDIKAILFYASLFPTLVNLQALSAGDVAIITLITIVTVGGVKLAYVFFAASIVEKLRARTASELPRKFGGALMIGCGSALIAKA